MSPELMTIGSCTLDCIIDIEDILRFEMFKEEEIKKYTAIEYSSKLNIENVRFVPGGSAANIAADCAMMGLESAYIGMIGKDFSANMCIEDLDNRGVNTSFISQTDEANTAFSVILKTEWGKDRSILAYKGANDLITSTDIKENLFTDVKAFAWTSLTKDNSCKAAEKCIRLTKNHGGRVYGAPSMSIIKNNPKWAKKLISQSDVLSLNKEEAKAYTGKTANTSIIKEFIGDGIELISITNGSKGAIISDGDTIINNGVYDIDTEDMTGAGDAFMSGIIISEFRGYDLQMLSKFSSALGAFEAKEIGVREGIPHNFERIEDFIEEEHLNQVFSTIK